VKIESVKAVHVRIPLDQPYVFARGTMTAFDNVVVRIETDEGIVGYGESVPLFRSSTGDASAMAKLIKGPVAECLIGADPFNVEALVACALDAAGGNVDGVAGVDVALWDIMGKYLGQPIYRLIGGLCQDSIAVDYTIGAADPAAMAEVAVKVHKQGFQGVVVKVTGESVEKGIERVRQVRAALPVHCTVRADCNGGFTQDEALEFLRGIMGLDIEFVEQPVPAEDVEGLKLCRQTGIPISVDESLITLRDALTLVSEEACDVMNIKVPRVGGFLLAKRMAAIADAAGLPVVVGGRTALEISRAASRHFAASTCGAQGRKHEGPGPASQALSDDVVARRTTKEKTGKAGGFVEVEQGPGLGIEVFWDKVERYAVTQQL
jgi:L-alanine-DL-glutamate epimerase-like enolase superfamily enzyme